MSTPCWSSLCTYMPCWSPYTCLALLKFPMQVYALLLAGASLHMAPRTPMPAGVHTKILRPAGVPYARLRPTTRQKHPQNFWIIEKDIHYITSCVLS